MTRDDVSSLGIRATHECIQARIDQNAIAAADVRGSQCIQSDDVALYDIVCTSSYCNGNAL